MGSAVALAVVVRVLFLADKPLWRDEAWVALVSADPVAAATGGRAAPLGFLAITRFVVGLDLASLEISYRMVPLLCGIAAVPLLAYWALALGASRIPALAVAWIAVGFAPLVYYSRELKSYDLDFLLAVVVPLFALRGFDSSPSSAASRWSLVVCVALTPWLSFGGIFAVCAVLAWGWIAWWPRLDKVQRRHWLATTFVFVASFAAVYAIALGTQASDGWTQSYWKHPLAADRNLALPAQFALALWKYASISTRYFFPDSWPLVAALAGVGAWTWPRPQRGFLVFLYVVTAAACATAAVMDRYLLVSGRHLLFVAPVLLLWTAGGLAAIGRRLSPRAGPAVALATAVAASLWWSAESISFRVGEVRTRPQYFFRFDILQDMDLAIEAAARLVPKGEPVLVSRKSSYAFQLYNRDRISRAHYCERLCAGFTRIATKWLSKVKSRGWMILTDEDTRSLGRLLHKEGFQYRSRADLRGVALWEIERRGTGRRPASNRKRPTDGEGSPPGRSRQR